MKHRTHFLLLPLLALWCTGCALTPVDPAGERMEEAKRHYLAGEDAYRVEDYETAVEEYAKAVAVKNDYAAAYFKRANALYRLGRSRESVVDYTRAASCFPSYRNAFFNRGEVYRAMGKMRSALRDYHRVQQIDPEFAPVYKRIGYILDQHFEQEHLKALSYFQRALALGGPDEQVELWIQRIEEDEAARLQLEQATSTSKEDATPDSEGTAKKPTGPALELEEEEKAYRERLEFLRGILREKLRESQEEPPSSESGSGDESAEESTSEKPSNPSPSPEPKSKLPGDTGGESGS